MHEVNDFFMLTLGDTDTRDWAVVVGGGDRGEGEGTIIHRCSCRQGCCWEEKVEGSGMIVQRDVAFNRKALGLSRTTGWGHD